MELLATVFAGFGGLAIVGFAVMAAATGSSVFIAGLAISFAVCCCSIIAVGIASGELY